MNYLSVDLYQDFQCIADACPNTCCAGWSIIIDKATKQKMIDSEETLKMRAEDWLFEQGDTTLAKLNNGRCCMLNENNLCNVVLKLGPEYLSRTCQQYPRLLVQYGNIIEAQMSMSCPEVISKLMDKENVKFDFSEYDTMEQPYEHAKLYLFESAVRTCMVNIMESYSHISLKARLYAIYKIVESAVEFYKQEQLDYNAFMEFVAFYFQENILMSFEKQLKGAVSTKACLNFVKELQTVLENIKVFEEDKEMVECTESYYSLIEESDYVLHWQLFREATESYKQFYNNYWVCHLFTDSMSIPDYERVKEKILYIAVEFCLIQSVALANFVMNGGELNRDEYILIISRICRTMEHDQKFRESLTLILCENNAISLAGLMLMVLE